MENVSTWRNSSEDLFASRCLASPVTHFRLPLCLEGVTIGSCLVAIFIGAAFVLSYIVARSGVITRIQYVQYGMLLLVCLQCLLGFIQLVLSADPWTEVANLSIQGIILASHLYYRLAETGGGWHLSYRRSWSNSSNGSSRSGCGCTTGCAGGIGTCGSCTIKSNYWIRVFRTTLMMVIVVYCMTFLVSGLGLSQDSDNDRLRCVGNFHIIFVSYEWLLVLILTYYSWRSAVLLKTACTDFATRRNVAVSLCAMMIVMALSAIIKTAYRLTLRVLVDVEAGCSSLFENQLAIYTFVLFLLHITSLVLPNVAILFVHGTEIRHWIHQEETRHLLHLSSETPPTPTTPGFGAFSNEHQFAYPGIQPLMDPGYLGDSPATLHDEATYNVLETIDEEDSHAQQRDEIDFYHDTTPVSENV